jgi:uncharacterized protein (DUF302 family)
MKMFYYILFVALVSLNLYAQHTGSYPVIEHKSDYSFTETVEKIKTSAEEKGWRVPAVIDLRMSLEKNGYKVRPVNIIEICNPEYAAELLNNSSQRSLSAYMPCRISVYENENGEVYISMMDISVFKGEAGIILPEPVTKAFSEMEVIVADIVQTAD